MCMGSPPETTISIAGTVPSLLKKFSKVSELPPMTDQSHRNSRSEVAPCWQELSTVVFADQRLMHKKFTRTVHLLVSPDV